MLLIMVVSPILSFKYPLSFPIPDPHMEKDKKVRLVSTNGASDNNTKKEYSELYESDIEEFLFDHPEVIEPNLMIIGRQVNTEIVGIIDLLAKDDNGNIVVIKLKRGKGTDKIVGQISRYMAWIEEKYKKAVRGIIIVKEADTKLNYAVKSLKNQVEIQVFKEKIPIKENVKYC